MRGDAAYCGRGGIGMLNLFAIESGCSDNVFESS
jgi:hypothetical protein